MRQSYLLKTLILPLSVLTVLSLVLAYIWPVEGLFINLAATFLGTLLTVFYVDRVLRAHERQVWAGVDRLIRLRIERFANLSIHGFRTAFGFGADIMTDPRNISDPDNVHLALLDESIRIAENLLMPAAATRVPKIDRKAWLWLVQHLQGVSNFGEQIIQAFGHRLDAETLHLILQIEEAISSIQTDYQIFPDVLGVPDAELRPSLQGSVQDTVKLKHRYNVRVSENAVLVMRLASQLLRSLSTAGRDR
jgi:hypothetical protein